MADCLVVSRGAAALAQAVREESETPVTLTLCTSSDQASDAYDGEAIVLGDPGLIAPVLKRFDRLRWIQSTWAGVTPLIDASRRDYLLTGIKGVFGPQMSEYVFGHLLARELMIVARHEAQRRRQWDTRLSGVLAGRCLGILGTGSIGRHVAGTGKAFGMTVRGLSLGGAPVAPFDSVAAVGELAAFLPSCDYLVATLPDTPATTGLLNRETLPLLPPHAVFVNVGRSNVVDDEALVAALENGRLGGAVLDVFDEEPLPDQSPLWNAPNLTVTGHIAAVSHPGLIAPIFVDNLRRFRAGEPLRNVVDFARGY